MRCRWRRAGWLAGAALAAGTLAQASAPGPARPNVLLLTVDTLRADRLSSYGYSRATSPNLDRLIAAGAKFSQARTVEPLTGPAVCSMMTSRYPHEHGASRNGLRMRPGLDSLPVLLRASGYRTAAFVANWTLKDKVTGLGEHFDEYEMVLKRKRWMGLFSSEATAEDVTQVAIDWLEAHVESDDSRPFLLWVHYVEPHAPYRSQERYRRALGLPGQGELSPSDRYDTEVAEADHASGVLLARLSALALDSRTLIVFTSDHGESLGEHNYWGHGRQLHEPGLRIPLSVTWPDRVRPQSIDAPALNLDLAPTIAGLLGLERPAGFAGYDWSGTLLGSDVPPADRLTEHQAHKGVVLSGHDSDLARRSGLLEIAVIQRGLKEIYRLKNGRYRMFDLNADPLELAAVAAGAGGPSERLQQWERVVESGLEGLDADVPSPLDEESVERLRALGYTD